MRPHLTRRRDPDWRKRARARNRPTRTRVVGLLAAAFVLLLIVLMVDSARRGTRTVDEWHELVGGGGILAALLLVALKVATTGTRWSGPAESAAMAVFATTALVTAGNMLIHPWDAIDFADRGKAGFTSPGEVRIFAAAWGFIGLVVLGLWLSRVCEWWRHRRHERRAGRRR